MRKNNKCLIYANSHHENMRYVIESEKSCQSFKQYIKDVDAILYCDDEHYQSVNFDHVYYAKFVVPDQLQSRMHKNGQMLVKHQAMLETQYDLNLVLGSDTYALSSQVNSIFELLDKFDVAVAHAPYRIVSMSDSDSIPVPESYPEFNCDVIAYRKNDRVLKLIEQWQDYYRKDNFGHPHDQGTFRYLIYNSDLRVATLAPEFNYRGNVVRKDTIILQNRDMIENYLDASRASTSAPSIKSRIKRLLKQN